MTISPREREQRLIDAVDKLAKYYGIRTSRQDISSVVTQIIRNNDSSIPTDPSTDTSPTYDNAAENAIADLINNLFNSPIGAVPIDSLAAQLNNVFVNPSTAPTSDTPTQPPIGNIIQIIGDTPAVRDFSATLPTMDNQTPGVTRTYNSNLKYVSIFSPEPNKIPMVNLNEDERTNLVDKNIYVVLISSPNLNLSNRYTKPVSIFLNGVPTIEMAKAVPYVEVEFEFPLPALDENNRLLSPSIYKAMLGGVQANPGTPIWSMQNAYSSSNASSNLNYTSIGMEAFLSPQTLFNRRVTGDANDIRANQILDPTRPLLTIKQFGTQETPSFGMYGYRTARLSLALNDRSRMPDFAPFFRADLRGTTRVKIEYGWHHPEGEDLIRRGRNISPYVDLINGMRRVEKFQIRNSSFSFRENGIVDISLDLVTLGQSQLTSELIIRNPNSNLSTAIRDLEEVQTQLSNILARTSLLEEESTSTSDRPSVEIRGTEVLYAASDAFSSGFNLSESDRGTLRNLLNSLNNRRGPGGEILTQVRESLIRIWGEGDRAGSGAAGAVAAVRTAISSDVQEQVNDLRKFCLGRPATGEEINWPIENEQGAADPLVLIPGNSSRYRPTGLRGFYGARGIEIASGNARGGRRPAPPDPPREGEGGTTPPEPPPPPTPPGPAPPARPAQAATAAEGAAAAAPAGGTTTTPAAAEAAPAAPASSTPARRGGGRGSSALPIYLRSGTGYGSGLHQYSVSLATLMTNFVARPLLQTGTYKEVQLIFYPFNENAAYASRMNIGNFEINLGMLTEMLIEYRLANTARSAMLTLSEFWSFINTNFIDNPASSSYGLWDNDGPFYTSVPTSVRTERLRDNPDATVRYLTEPAYDETTLNSRISSLLINGNVTPTGEFRPPQLRLFTECIPIHPDYTSSTTTRANENILKIHIYDQQTASVAGAGEILIAERNRALSLEGRPETTDVSEYTVAEQWRRYRHTLITQAIKAGILEPVSLEGAAADRYVIRGGSRSIKNFIMNNMPYLNPGMQNSLIKGVSINSLQDEAAATLNLVNSPRTAELISPNGEEPGNLPLQIIPVEMSMTTYGCPLIAFGSQYFVDLNTGTTADDIYNVNSINSEFEPGSYSTSLKLRPISGYTRYRNYLNEIREAIDRIDENLVAERDAPTTGTVPRSKFTTPAGTTLDDDVARALRALDSSRARTRAR